MGGTVGAENVSENVKNVCKAFSIDGDCIPPTLPTKAVTLQVYGVPWEATSSKVWFHTVASIEALPEDPWIPLAAVVLDVLAVLPWCSKRGGSSACLLQISNGFFWQ